MIAGSPLLLVHTHHVATHVALAQHPPALLALDPLHLEGLALASLEMPLIHVAVAVVAEDAHCLVRSKTTFVVKGLAANVADELKLLNFISKQLQPILYNCLSHQKK